MEVHAHTNPAQVAGLYASFLSAAIASGQAPAYADRIAREAVGMVDTFHSEVSRRQSGAALAESAKHAVRKMQVEHRADGRYEGPGGMVITWDQNLARRDVDCYEPDGTTEVVLACSAPVFQEHAETVKVAVADVLGLDPAVIEVTEFDPFSEVSDGLRFSLPFVFQSKTSEKGVMEKEAA